MHQATTWPPACARAFAQGFPLRPEASGGQAGLRSKATAGSQSRNTHQGSLTLRISLNRTSRISAQIERDLAKLFLAGA